ncbi:hypothetical protein ACLKA6_006797 [Drosophila palustris]
MKFLIVLVACVALVVADQLPLTAEQRAKLREGGKECIEKEGITKEQAQALRGGNFDNVDGKVKCFASCFLEKANLVVDGQINTDEIQTKLSPLVGADRVKEIQAKCDSIKGTDNCDTAFQLYQCYYKNNAEL